MNNTEETLKKMAIVIEKISQKVDELDKRITKLEMNRLADNNKNITEAEKQVQNINREGSGSAFGKGFMGSLLGSFAGMGLFNLLFNSNVSSEELAKEVGVSDVDSSELDKKLEELAGNTEQLEENIEKIEPSDQEVAMDDELPDVEPNIDYFETDFGLDDDEWIA
ncbi:hypothetical protein [Persephonella sp.]